MPSFVRGQKHRSLGGGGLCHLLKATAGFRHVSLAYLFTTEDSVQSELKWNPGFLCSEVRKVSWNGDSYKVLREVGLTSCLPSKSHPGSIWLFHELMSPGTGRSRTEIKQPAEQVKNKNLIAPSPEGLPKFIAVGDYLLLGGGG